MEVEKIQQLVMLWVDGGRPEAFFLFSPVQSSYRDSQKYQMRDLVIKWIHLAKTFDLQG